MPESDISAADPYERQRVAVLDSQMAYVDTAPEANAGDAVVFLHGNPTSSYLWRNVIPHVADAGRCIAPDLIGQGDSDKLDDSGPGSYRYVEHRDYLFDLLEQLGVDENVTLGFDWARQHPDAVKGICYMEAIVQPIASWDEWPENARGIFQGFRSEAGEGLVLEKNFFVEGVLPGAIVRNLTAEEHDEYRRPFAEPGESRRPTLTWPREIPIEGEPADMVAIVADYAEFLAGSPIPKLFVNADPGAILTGAQREFCRTWPNQVEVTVAGAHFIQEDSPDEIGAALADWYAGL